MKKLQKNRITFDWKLLPMIVSLAWPTMLEHTMQTAVQYIDTAMVGSLGTAATAAAGSTTTVNWLIIITLNAVGVGFLSYIAQARGAGEHQLVRRAVSQAVLAVMLLGTLMTALTLSLSGTIPRWMQVDLSVRDAAAAYFFVLYLSMLPRTAMIVFGSVFRAVGDSRTPMRVGVLVNLLNVILNTLLIYAPRTVIIGSSQLRVWGAGMGVTGAAAASALSFFLGGILITAALLRHPELSPAGLSLRPDAAVLRPCARVAGPLMLQGFCTSAGYVAFASMINALGEISTAAHTIANTVESAFYIPGFGMQAAAASLTGNAIGAGQNRRLKDTAKLLLLCEFILMILSGCLLFCFAPRMVGLFTADAAVLLLGATVLRMVACSEPFYGVSIIIEGILQGAGKTTKPFVFNLIGMWGVRIVGTYICTRLLHMSLVAAWACMIAHNLLLFTLYTVYYHRGRWNPLEAGKDT